MRLPVVIPNGVKRAATETQSAGRWRRANLVRSYGDDVGPIGGWRQRSSGVVPGKARAILAYSTAGGDRRIGIGTEQGLYVQNASGSVFDITPTPFVGGIADATVNRGFGGGFYGAGSYGTPRPDTGTPQPATVWSLDNWGQYLVACCPSDGQIVMWEDDTAVPSAAVTNAPTGCVGVLTTQDRFMVALGSSGNPRLVEWSNRSDETVWAPSSTNLAGNFELDTFGGIIVGVELRSASLILTEVDAHQMAYVGLPSVYLFNRIGEGCGAISAGCVASQGDFAMWWSPSGFMRYDGAMVPVDCPIETLQTGYNTAQRSKITAFHNAKFNEFWWFYPSSASTENDSYVSFNYITGEWWEGSLSRLSGAGQGAFAFPLLMGPDGLAYEHENGVNFDDATPFARSGPYSLGDGSRVMRVTGIYPSTVGTCTIGFMVRDYPMSPQRQVAQYDLAAGKTDVRFTGRAIRLRVNFASNDARFGRTHLEVAPGGAR